MKKGTLIETLGGLAKEERLKTLADHIMPNTYVLETEEPFPGYHGANLPTEAKPISAFLITRTKYSPEKILRLTHIIKKYFPHTFDAVPGKICMQNDVLPCIRLRGFTNYELIGELQKCFFSEGIEFAKRKNVSADAVIQLRKHFTIEEIDEEIYRDVDEHSTYYFRIPKQMSWQLFLKVTEVVRHNTAADFDAAMAAIYTRDILDVVRIYATGISIETLKELKKRYTQELEKLH
ncbi:MAG: hypothetical protein H6538_05475 [Bacteroidales bacterium]|nr:hypothetical protein [Bacteroidales bacterium]MCB9000114.1 hypothetical protein [Bacteroidales bacterium]